MKGSEMRGQRWVMIACCGLLGVALGLAAIAAGADPATAAKRTGDALDRFLKAEQQKELGFQKLDAQERLKVAALLSSLVKTGSLYQTAYSYMESEGFSPVTVHGTREIKLHEGDLAEDYLIVEDRWGTLWACDDVLWLSAPGKYWAEMKAWGPSRMIDSSGREHRIFTAEDASEHFR